MGRWLYSCSNSWLRHMRVIVSKITGCSAVCSTDYASSTVLSSITHIGHAIYILESTSILVGFVKLYGQIPLAFCVSYRGSPTWHHHWWKNINSWNMIAKYANDRCLFRIPWPTRQWPVSNMGNWDSLTSVSNMLRHGDAYMRQWTRLSLVYGLGACSAPNHCMNQRKLIVN